MMTTPTEKAATNRSSDKGGRQRSTDVSGPPPGNLPLFMKPPKDLVTDGVVGGRCYGCHTQCGLRAHLKDGKVVGVTGEPFFRNRGALCPKGLASVQKLHAADRLNYPMKRTRPKGDRDPGWVRISWEEALDTIADKLKKIQETYGAHAIASGQGTGRFSVELSARLKNCIGSPNTIHPGHMCRGPMAATTCLTVGHHLRADFDSSKCMVFWGRNEVWAHPAFNGPHIIENIMDRGAKLIVVDPRFEHPLAHKADIFLPVRPGTDGALMLSWIHVILEESLFDGNFLKNHTNGPFLVREDTGNLLLEGDLGPTEGKKAFLPFPACIEDRRNRPVCMVWDRLTHSARPAGADGVNPELFGTYTVNGIRCRTALELLRREAAKYPPEKAARICWTGSAEKIRQAARMFAESSSACLDAGSFGIQGLEGGHTNTFQILRACLCLDGVTGNINRPGGDCGLPHWRWITGDWKREGGPRTMTPWGAPDDDLSVKLEGPCPDEPALGEYPLQPGLPSMTGCFRAMKSGKPYPIKAYVKVQGNPLGGWCEDQTTVREGLLALEFMVDMDLHLTPTGHLADIVLPAGLGPFERGEHPVIEPLYERRSDEWFYIELGKRLSPEWWPWPNEAAYWKWRGEMAQKECGNAAAAGFTIERGVPAPPLNYFEEMDERTGAPVGFPTPTGKVEIFSQIAREHGIAPIACYIEPHQTPVGPDELKNRFPLVLTTGARLPVYYHSEHRSSPYQRALFPHPQFEIHPDTAKTFGIEPEKWAWIETKTGRIRMKAILTPGILPGVVSMKHGWWQGCPSLGLPGYSWDGANANMLCAGDVYDPALGVPGVRSQLCRVTPADAEPYSWEPPFYGSGIPEECGGQETETVQPLSEDK